MMGRQHVIIGGCVVAIGTTAGLLPWSWPEAAVMMSGLIIAGSDWPDIDHKTSSVTKSWGAVTLILCYIIRFIARRVYRVTRTPHDPKTRDPHRTLTHTWPGSLLFGVLATVGLCAHPLSAIIVGALLFGVAIRPLNPGLQWISAGLGGFMANELYPVMSTDYHWLLWFIAFSFGCLTHVWSDCVTKEGAPLSWPFTWTTTIGYADDASMKVESPMQWFKLKPQSTKTYRWHMVGPPSWMRFYTGGAVEIWVVRGIVVLTLLACYALLTH